MEEAKLGAILSVRINSQKADSDENYGSGVIYKTNNSDYDLVFTAKHCICRKNSEVCKKFNKSCDTCIKPYFAYTKIKIDNPTDKSFPSKVKVIEVYNVEERDFSVIKVSKFRLPNLRTPKISLNTRFEGIYGWGFPSINNFNMTEYSFLGTSKIPNSDSIMNLPFESNVNSNLEKIQENLSGFSGTGIFDINDNLIGIYTETQCSASGFGVIIDEHINSFLIKNELESFKIEDSLQLLEINGISKESGDLANNHFIKDIIHTELYIPRTLIECSDYSNTPTDALSVKTSELYNLIKKESKVVILGSAGQGKSLELKETAIKVADNGCFSIFRSLNIFTPDKDIEYYMPDKWNKIPQEKVVLLFDGYDEIRQEDYNIFKRKLSFFQQKYPDIKIIISCRTNQYETFSGGEINGFKSYYLLGLSISDVMKYVFNNHACDGELFIQNVYNKGFQDIVKIPFFLELLIEYYKNNNNSLPVNITSLIRSIIDNRWELDYNHYNTTNDIYTRKRRVFKILRNISVAMEIVGVNIINDEELEDLINDEKKLGFIKYFTAFKKDEKNVNNWKFEHNNFQEFLCAELLAEQSFDVVKKFICYDDYDKVIPTWLNTISFLLSILEDDHPLFKELTTWIINNDIEIIVKIEIDKLSIETKEGIFNKIFNYYKELKIWIDSNKFNLKELALFGRTEKCLEFLVKEADDESNDIIVRKNALNIISEFRIGSNNVVRIKSFLFKLIENNLSDSHFIYSIIRVFNSCKFYDKATVEKIFLLVSEKKNEWVRSIMYHYLHSSEFLENYIDYFIEGYTLLDIKCGDREDTNFGNESWELGKGLKKFKSEKSLIKIFDAENYNNIVHRIGAGNEILECVFNNLEIVFAKDTNNIKLFNSVINVFKYYSIRKTFRLYDIILKFFDRTNTKQIAFDIFLEDVFLKKDRLYGINRLVELIDENNIDKIVYVFNEGKLSEGDVKSLFWRTRNRLGDLFLKQINAKTSIKLEMPLEIDWNKKDKDMNQRAFDLLFSKEKFINECVRIFGNKKTLTYDELWKDKYEHIEDDYIESALDLLRGFVDSGTINKTDILEKLRDYDFYMIDETFSYLKNDEILVSNTQIELLREWFNNNITKIDFTKVISSRYAYGISTINELSIYLMCYIKKFGFECSQDILLDMLLAFNNYNVDEFSLNFDDIVFRIEDQLRLNNRISENIRDDRCPLFNIYEKHIIYAFENNLIETYESIVQSLLQDKYQEHDKFKIIDFLFKYNIDKVLIKSVFDNPDIEIVFHLVHKLIVAGDVKFCIEKLLKLSFSVSDSEHLRKIYNFLIQCREQKGIKLLIDWIKKEKKPPFHYENMSIAFFDNVSVLPLFIELLELSYTLDIDTSDVSFHDIKSIVLAGLEKLALCSNKNFESVIYGLSEFIKNHIDEYENVGFLNRTIEGIKRDFYKNNYPRYTFEEAKVLINSNII